MKAYKIIASNSVLCYLILLLLMLSFSSCVHYYYAPNSSNVPLFKEKGEGRINGYYTEGSEISGGEVQAAYSVSNHVGLIFNTAFVSGSDDSYGSNKIDRGNGSLIEGGLGYYQPLTMNWIFETYGGFGVGQAKNEYSQGGSSKVNFTKYFIQPSLGFTIKNLDVGIASKFSFLNMKVNGGSYANQYDNFDLEYIEAHPNSVLWEPSIFIRFGFPELKAQLQYTPSFNLNNKDLAQELDVFSAGICIAIYPRTHSGD